MCSKYFIFQFQIYHLWNQIRGTKSNEIERSALDRLNRIRRFRSIERITTKMVEKVERLYIFENEEQIDLNIEKNELAEAAREVKRIHRKVNVEKVDESYLQPEVGAKEAKIKFGRKKKIIASFAFCLLSNQCIDQRQITLLHYSRTLSYTSIPRTACYSVMHLNQK